jgi:hypothetical protein
MSTNPTSTPSDTESVISYAKERSIFDEEELYNTLTDVYLPEVKQLPVQKLGTNLAYTTSCHSLSIATGYYSAKNKLDDDGLDFEQEDSRPCSPDTLHTPERYYQRQGPCRYIFEEDPSFVVSSKRGWMNFSKSAFRTLFFDQLVSSEVVPQVLSSQSSLFSLGRLWVSHLIQNYRLI